MYAYINSLPRGEQKKATNALRNYLYGPGKMQPDDAIERYKEWRVRDAQGPLVLRTLMSLTWMTVMQRYNWGPSTNCIHEQRS